ncbi:MAG TPA: hypothetical protein VGB50_05440 [Flavobacterium sp.]|jgi:hypothetical protein
MSKEKGIYTGIIERDEYNNYFCGEYLLDYKYTESKFKLGDRIVIKSAVANQSDMSANWYPMKTKDFVLAGELNK